MTRTGSPAVAVADAFSTSSQTTAATTAGPIGEREPHVVRSGPRPADLALADEQHLVDGAAVSRSRMSRIVWVGPEEFHVRGVVGRGEFLTSVGEVADWGSEPGNARATRSARLGPVLDSTAATCQVTVRSSDLGRMAFRPARCVHRFGLARRQ